MLVSFLFIVLSVLGLGGFCPVPRAPLGVRLTFGWSALTILLILGAVFFALPLRATSLAIAALAAIGLVARARTAFQREDLRHPVVPFAVLAAVMIAFGPGLYHPVAWDELSYWMYITREIVVADKTIAPGLIYPNQGHTLGWQLLMAYPQALFSDFIEGRSYPSVVALHLSTLALAADFVRHLVLGRGMDDKIVVAAGWIAIPLLLAAQAMWILFPTLLLIEKPQIYSYVAAIMLAIMTIGAQEGNAPRWGLTAGIALAASYLLKITAITLFPAWGIFALILLMRRNRTAVIAVAAMVLPALLTAAGWPLIVPSEGGCQVKPLLVISKMLQLHDEVWMTAKGLGGLLSAYYAEYKPAVSIAAIAGLAMSLRHRAGALLTSSLIVFFATYLTALLFSYVGCWSGYEKETFISYERYGRVILRVLHVFGLAMLLVSVIEWAGRRNCFDFRGRRVAAAGAVLFAAFLGWQGIKAHAALHEIAARDSGDERDIAVLAVRRNLEKIKSWADSRGGGSLPRIMIVAQKSTGFENVIAAYHALGVTRGGPIRSLELEPIFSFGQTAGNIWMRPLAREEILTIAGKADLLWPITLDDYARNALAPILSACPDGPFVVRTGTTWGCPPRR